MSSTQESNEEKAPLKIFRAPAHDRKTPKSRGIFDCLFRKKQRNGGSQTTFTVGSEESSRKRQGENTQKAYKGGGNLSLTTLSTKTRKVSRCKSRMKRLESVENDDTLSRGQTQFSFSSGGVECSPRTEPSFKTFNQTPKMQVVQIETETVKTLKEAQKAESESRNLEVCPAFSIDIACQDLNRREHKMQRNHKRREVSPAENSERRASSQMYPDVPVFMELTGRQKLREKTAKATDRPAHLVHRAKDMCGLNWTISKEIGCQTPNFKSEDMWEVPKMCKETARNEPENLSLPFPADARSQAPVRTSLNAGREANRARKSGAVPKFSGRNHEAPSEVISPSSSSSSVAPKPRKGALKPFVDGSPVVAYTRRYRAQSDSSSTSSSDSDEAQRRRPHPTPRPRYMPNICYSTKRRDISDEDRRRMNAFLNQFSSVHISRNLKDPIPKDPETLPGFSANTSRRRMAESLSKHGASLFGSRSQARKKAPTSAQNNNGKKGKKSSWFFPATMDELQIPRADMASKNDDSQTSTEIRSHDLDVGSRGHLQKALNNEGMKDRGTSTRSGSKIANDWSLKEQRFTTMPVEPASETDRRPPRVDKKKSYRFIHSTETPLAEQMRTENENLRVHLPPQEVEKREVFLGSVDSEFDDHPFGVPNYVVHNVLSRNTFCSEVNFEKDWTQNLEGNKSGKNENGNHLSNSLYKDEYQKKSTATKSADKPGNKDPRGNQAIHNIPPTSNSKPHNPSTRLPTATVGDDDLRTATERREWDDGGTERNMRYSPLFFDHNAETTRRPYVAPMKAAKTEESRCLDKSQTSSTTLNWTIIMKHTPKKNIPRTTNVDDGR